MFQSSLRDLSVAPAYPGLRPGLRSAVPAGLSSLRPRCRLFVGQSLDRILASSLQRGVRRTNQCPRQSDEGRVHDPMSVDGKRDAGKAYIHCLLQQESGGDTQNNANDREKGCFPQNQTDDVRLGGAQRLQDPDLARTLQNSGVHRLENNDESDHHRQSDHYVERIRKGRKMFRRHLRKRFRQRLYLVVRQPGVGMDFLLNELLVFWVIALQEDDRGVVFRAKQRAQGSDRQIFASTFAMFDDAANAEGVVEYLDCVPYRVVLVRPGEDIVDDDIVGSLDWAPGQEHKGAQRVEAVIIDAPNRLYTVFHG